MLISIPNILPPVNFLYLSLFFHTIGGLRTVLCNDVFSYLIAFREWVKMDIRYNAYTVPKNLDIWQGFQKTLTNAFCMRKLALDPQNIYCYYHY